MTRPRLTKAQRRLLDEVIEADPLYVKKYGPFARTIEALAHKGYVRCSEPDYSRLGMDGWVAVTPCPGHNDTEGPHHDPECCLWAEERDE